MGPGGENIILLLARPPRTMAPPPPTHNGSYSALKLLRTQPHPHSSSSVLKRPSFPTLHPHLHPCEPHDDGSEVQVRHADLAPGGVALARAWKVEPCVHKADDEAHHAGQLRTGRSRGMVEGGRRVQSKGHTGTRGSMHLGWKAQQPEAAGGGGQVVIDTGILHRCDEEHYAIILQ